MEISKYFGYPGRLLSGSKSGYMTAHPEHLVVFNSNLILMDRDGSCEKVWHGDLDITTDREKLLEIASESGKRVYVLLEMDGRFENEAKPLIERFVYSTDPEGNEEIGGTMKTYFSTENGNIKRK